MNRISRRAFTRAALGVPVFVAASGNPSLYADTSRTSESAATEKDWDEARAENDLRGELGALMKKHNMTVSYDLSFTHETIARSNLPVEELKRLRDDLASQHYIPGMRGCKHSCVSPYSRARK